VARASRPGPAAPDRRRKNCSPSARSRSKATAWDRGRGRKTRPWPARRQQDLVGPADVQGAGIHWAPVLAVVADVRGLGRGQDGEGDGRRRQSLQGRRVHGRLGQPHALGRPAEAGREIIDGPGDFSSLFISVVSGHDHVVVDLGQGIAMPQPGQTLAVGLRSRAWVPGPSEQAR
jgi:hypothetical protein